ncbi:hypothetical protein REPUB_Repub08aG0110000 [Reevesia pubescens]
MKNPYLRRAMCMKPDQKGVRIRRVDPKAPESGFFFKFLDIMLNFDGVDIANVGTYTLLDVFSQPHNIPWKLKSTRLRLSFRSNGLMASTVEELMEVGPKKLKEALAALKTGGTIQQCAERLFLTKKSWTKRHFAKGSPIPEQNGSTAVLQDINSLKNVALMEAKMKKLCDLLSKGEAPAALDESILGEKEEKQGDRRFSTERKKKGRGENLRLCEFVSI